MFQLLESKLYHIFAAHLLNNIIKVSHLSYKTISANRETVNKEWLLVDADGQPLGRVASQVARLIRGKHKVDFTPHVDCGDNVIIINAEKVTLSGNKWENKEYISHTGYPGGQRSVNASSILKKFPERLLEKAIKGMLPKSRLGRKLFGNLHVFVGDTHNKQAQKPKKVEFN